MSTPIPPSVTEIPFADAEALERWIMANQERVTPLALERLLNYEGFCHVGDMPTATTVRCAVWRPAKAEEIPTMARFAALVYHTDVILRRNLVAALTVLSDYRAWRLRTKQDL